MISVHRYTVCLRSTIAIGLATPLMWASWPTFYTTFEPCYND